MKSKGPKEQFSLGLSVFVMLLWK